MSKQSWSVIIPCYNEAGTIKELARRVINVLNQIASEYEIILLDDGSTDGSPDLIKALAGEVPEIRPIYHLKNRGLGVVLRKGYLSAKYENVVSIPGDGQFDPSEIIPFSDFKKKTFISFYRKENLTYSFFRNKLSFIHKYLNKVLLGIELKDVNWAIIFKTEDFRNMDIKLHSTLIKTEICSKQLLLGYKAVEVPSIYHPRVYGESKGASYKMIYQAIKDLLKLFIVVRQFKWSLKKDSKTKR